ncbi:hypothetical protein [Erythrobacter sp. R86502]|uniref:hypothetical protein n=1 Tax=Erythrobacter sp. R86502 TaxID=3093846 RepID=UPI0036D38008
MTTRTPAMRRYFRVHLALTALYLALVLLASLFVPDDAAPTPMVIAFALLPGFVVLGWIWNMGRLLVEMQDEYLRMLEVRKMLWASAITLSICGGWGLVELFASVPRLPVFYVFPIWCVGLAVGQVINRFTVGDGGCA